MEVVIHSLAALPALVHIKSELLSTCPSWRTNCLVLQLIFHFNSRKNFERRRMISWCINNYALLIHLNLNKRSSFKRAETYFQIKKLCHSHPWWTSINPWWIKFILTLTATAIANTGLLHHYKKYLKIWTWLRDIQEKFLLMILILALLLDTTSLLLRGIILQPIYLLFNTSKKLWLSLILGQLQGTLMLENRFFKQLAYLLRKRTLLKFNSQTLKLRFNKLSHQSTASPGSINAFLLMVLLSIRF